jgi:biopolymer transport protein ExbD
MAKRRDHSKYYEATAKVDFTPIIDCVFNLVIFFMIVTDMTNRELEELTLPIASQAVSDKNPEKGRMIVNVMRDGKYRISRHEYTLDEVANQLYAFAEIHRDNTQRRLAEKPILIRCDYATDFKYVQEIMQKCADRKIGIWMIQLAASQPAPSSEKPSGGD